MSITRYFDDDFDAPEGPEQPSRDTKIDEAKAVLMEMVFKTEPRTTFYERQLLIMLEDTFYHWITAKALHELTAEHAIESAKVALGEKTEIRFYFAKRHRYWKRQAEVIRKLVLRFSNADFGHALGHHSEGMFDAALAHFGFMPTAKKVSSYNGVIWPHSGHDLDRTYMKDEIVYGAEIKNKLNYIDRDELDTKLGMCKLFGIRPLFIMRMAPKSYIHEIDNAGGYALIFKYQLYPHGHGDFAKEVRETLGLPVDCPTAIADGTIQRFLNWHRKTRDAR